MITVIKAPYSLLMSYTNKTQMQEIIPCKEDKHIIIFSGSRHALLLLKTLLLDPSSGGMSKSGSLIIVPV